MNILRVLLFFFFAGLRTERPSAIAAMASAALDARRYRWLREPQRDKSGQGSTLIRMGIGAFSYEIPAGDDLDASIDAALKKDKGEPFERGP